MSTHAFDNEAQMNVNLDFQQLGASLLYVEQMPVHDWRTASIPQRSRCAKAHHHSSFPSCHLWMSLDFVDSWQY